MLAEGGGKVGGAAVARHLGGLSHAGAAFFQRQAGAQQALGARIAGQSQAARHVGKTWGDNANTFRIPAHTLFDAKLDWDPGQHFAALRGSFAQINVQNLANKHYVASCANNFSCFMGKVRRVTVSAGYRW